jgi:ribosome biogenesis ATPase
MDAVPLVVPAAVEGSLNESLRNQYTSINQLPVKTQSRVVRVVKRVKEEPSASTSRSPDSSTQWKGEIPTARFSDFGGIGAVLKSIYDLIERPLRFPQIYEQLGLEPSKGILLHGPSGCGKTTLASAIAGELGVPLIKIAGPEIVSGMSGESESRLREVFVAAASQAPCILFIDEIDSITPKRENSQKEMEKRIVSQLLSCLDDLKKPVIVLGATSRPDSLDPSLRRAGRFDREVCLGIPNEAGRLDILSTVCKGLKISESVSFESVARMTPGYVGADLKALAREAANCAINRILSDSLAINNDLLALISIESLDFEMAISKVQPSAKREGFAVVPNVTWDDIGALSQVREELRMAVVEPLRNPELFSSFGLSSPCGVLLWGPPGCGKTLLAKAVANETHSNFISVKGPELLNKFVGESERAVRQVFERARSSAPCIIFFDELDSICPKRSADSDSATTRVVNQLLTELDGLEERQSVYILAATNRPDIIDPAMTRPGRLDKLLYVGLPDTLERFEILKATSKRTPWADDVNLMDIACDHRCEGMSGADLSCLVREASLQAIREAVNLPTFDHALRKVHHRHMEIAFSKTRPSISHQDMLAYSKIFESITNK